MHDDNSFPQGIASANGRFYVVDDSDDKVYAYSDSGQWVPAADFHLHDDNGSPEGIAWANGRFYVVDDGDDKVYAYLDSGQYAAAADLSLHEDNASPGGIAYAYLKATLQAIADAHPATDNDQLLRWAYTPT